MTHAKSQSPFSTAERLQRLAQLYREGQTSELMDRTLEKLLTFETELARRQLREIQSDLGEFERKYGSDSTEFFRRFQAGQTDDRLDYVEWASLVQMANNLRERLHLLTGGDER
jgi:hypothetical protein